MLLVPAAAAEEAACGGSCQLAVVEFNLTVDDGEVDSLGQLRGAGVGGAVDDFSGVEDGDVREIAGLEKAAIGEMFALRGKRSDFADGRFERHEMFVANERAGEAG